MLPATDLGNHVLHQLMTPTKRVHAKMLYRRQVMAIGLRSNGTGVWFAPVGPMQLEPCSQVLAAQDFSSTVPVSCSLHGLSHLDHHVSDQLQHLRCFLFTFRSCQPVSRASGFPCTPCLHFSTSWSICVLTHFHPLAKRCPNS